MRKKLANYGADTPLLDFADTASPADEIREAKTEPPPQPPPDMPRGSPPRRLSRHRQNKSSISKNKETTHRGFVHKVSVHLRLVHWKSVHEKRVKVGFRAYSAIEAQTKRLDNATATDKNGNGQDKTIFWKLAAVASIVSCLLALLDAFF